MDNLETFEIYFLKCSSLNTMCFGVGMGGGFLVFEYLGKSMYCTKPCCCWL